MLLLPALRIIDIVLLATETNVGNKNKMGYRWIDRKSVAVELIGMSTWSIEFNKSSSSRSKFFKLWTWYSTSAHSFGLIFSSFKLYNDQRNSNYTIIAINKHKRTDRNLGINCIESVVIISFPIAMQLVYFPITPSSSTLSSNAPPKWDRKFIRSRNSFRSWTLPILFIRDFAAAKSNISSSTSRRKFSFPKILSMYWSRQIIYSINGL